VNVVNDLPAAAARFQAAAAAAGLHINVTVMPAATRTAEEAAAACGCALGQIVKSLIFKGKETGRPYLLLLAGTNRVNEKAVAVFLGEAIVRPDANFVRAATGFAIGGIPPLGHTTRSSPTSTRTCCNMGQSGPQPEPPHAVFEVDPKSLCATAGGIVIDMK
jgi:prolyl-tRNA editing enzyme YbaK/EbsC (Cys-tRNA(Pro) deacylase)